eukprot:43895_1
MAIAAKDETNLSTFLYITQEARTKFRHVLQQKSSFKIKKEIRTKYIVNGCKFTIETKIMCYKPDNNKPAIWYIETLYPGTPTIFFDSANATCMTEKFETKTVFEQDTSSMHITNLHTKAAAGGLIASRQFVLIAQRWQTGNNGKDLEAAGQSIKHKNFPKVKKVIRGNVMLSGFQCSMIDAKELLECYGIPAIKYKNQEGDEEVLKWHKQIRIWQSDIKGWIPQNVVDAATADNFAFGI